MLTACQMSLHRRQIGVPVRAKLMRRGSQFAEKVDFFNFLTGTFTFLKHLDEYLGFGTTLPKLWTL